MHTAFFPIGDDVHRTGQEDDAAKFFCQLSGKLDILPKLLFCDKVTGKRIHTGAGTAGLCLLQSGNRTDFRSVCADGGQLQLFEQLCNRLPAQGGSSNPTGSAGPGAKPVGSSTGIQHGRDKQMVECADVDVQRIGSSGDFGCLLRVACHDGTCAAGKQEIRAVIDGDKIGDAVTSGDFSRRLARQVESKIATSLYRASCACIFFKTPARCKVYSKIPDRTAPPAVDTKKGMM